MAAAVPAALKLLNGRGNGKDAAGRAVNMGPAFVRDAPDPPDCLSGEALAEWQRVVPELDRLHLLSRISRSSLASYCQTWQVFDSCTKTLNAKGLVYEAKQGLIPHPMVNIQRQAGAELRRWACEYGLTPASEQRVRAHEPEDEGTDFD